MMQQPIPQNPYSYQQLPESTDFTNFDFSNAMPSDQTYSDPSAFDTNNFSYGLNAAQPPTYPSNLAPQPSTELVRRNRNQQLAPQNAPQEAWNGFSNTGGHYDEEDEHELDRRVAEAKKDAQGKRKQIPPFVQKLASFLDNSNNTDLIRWSDDGRSFIVLDEDEFARTLIPELFKHSNYASFVRQLNMYGFHKTVNITDGSLRQSEKARKGVKPPSMYSHPYFRRNRPDLLWLIQKPTGKSTAKRKRDGTTKDEYDSDDERQYSPQPEGKPQQLSAPHTSQDLTQLPRNELVAVRTELQKLQTQQKFISQMITQLKEQNDQFYRQATAFQAQHDRHESSINAILTFLATFYNRSLEGHGAANLVNMFTNAQNQQQGSVVEEYNDSTPDPNTQLQRYRKPPLLLPGPVSSGQTLQPGSAVTQPSSARASISPPNNESNRGSIASVPPESAYSQSATTASPRVKTEASTPIAPNQLPENNDQMMDLINTVNATQASTPSTAAPAIDFNSIVDQYQNQYGNPLTPQQRDNTLANMMRQNGGTSNNNNALTQTAPNLDFNKLKQSNDHLEMLQNLQKQQADKVQELSQRLQPLSPTGTIPGLHDLNVNQDPFDLTGAPGDYDPSAFINFDDNSWDPNAGDNADFDFGFDTSGNGNNDWATNFDGAADGGDMFGTNDTSNSTLAPQKAGDNGGRVESVSSQATSPAATVPDASEEPGTPQKRQRRE